MDFGYEALERVRSRLRAIREEARTSQRELAEAMVGCGFPGWTKVTVSEVERGDRRLTFAEFYCLLHIWGLSLAELLPELERARRRPHPLGQRLHRTREAARAEWAQADDWAEPLPDPEPVEPEPADKELTKT